MPNQTYGFRIQLVDGTSLYDSVSSPDGTMSDEVFDAEASEMAERVATNGLPYETAHGRAYIPSSSIYAVECKPSGPYEPSDQMPIKFTNR